MDELKEQIITSLVGLDAESLKLVLSFVEKIKIKHSWEEEFEEFWKVYPVKKGKGAAKRKWQSKYKSLPSLDILISAVESQKKSEQWIKGYIPHPLTWLNQERWEDEEKTTLIGWKTLTFEEACAIMQKNRNLEQEFKKNNPTIYSRWKINNMMNG